MSRLNSFPSELNVAVIGASGAIGSEFVRQLAEDERVQRVYAFARRPLDFPEGEVVDPAAMEAVFRTNAIGPANVAQAFLPRMRRYGKTVFAALSARVGSIGDNRLGGWVSYRSSKAALNMILKTLSIEHTRQFPESVIAALHPGTVDSALSAPFQRRVPDGKLFSPAQSVGYLLSVIDGLAPEDSGGFFAWDGASIDY